MKNIKSSLILKNIFSFIKERRELVIVGYNKFLLYKLNITPHHYMKFSKKFIIFEENGKRKEYNYDNILIFEGEYLKGKINGKGK
jgi:hypothetical protein